MFVARVTRFAERFLSDRTFALIVAPALADFEFARNSGSRADYVAVLRAVAGAACQDAATISPLTFVALVFIPAAYYAFFFLLCLPAGLHRLDTRAMLVLAPIVSLVSLVPVAICYWPERYDTPRTDMP